MIDVATALVELGNRAITWNVHTRQERESLSRDFQAVILETRRRRAVGLSPLKATVALSGTLGVADGSLCNVARPKAPVYDEQMYLDR